MKQNNGVLKAVLTKYSIPKTIGDFIQTTASKAIAWNAVGEAAKTAVVDRIKISSSN